MLKSMLVGFLVVVLAVFAVGPVEAQTRTERDAFSAMASAVRAADSSPRALASARRAIERAFSVFEAQEQRRRSACCGGGMVLTSYDSDGSGGLNTAEVRAFLSSRARYADLVGQSSAPFRINPEGVSDARWNVVMAARGRVIGAHWRYVYAAAEAFRGAADGLEGVATGVVGFDVRHRSDLQRLASAKFVLIQVQGRVLGAASAYESGDGVHVSDADSVPVLRDLVNAAVAVVDGLESYRDARGVEAEIEASRRPLPPPSPAPAVEAPASAPAVEAPAVEEVVEEVSLADLWLRGVEEALQEAEARVSALAEITCGWGSDVTWARIRISNAFDVIHAGFVPGAGGQRFVPPADVRRPFEARLDGLRERLRGHERRIAPSCP